LNGFTKHKLNEKTIVRCVAHSQKYRLINYGDRHEFIIEDILEDGNFLIKDIHTLERYPLKDLIKFGKVL